MGFDGSGIGIRLSVPTPKLLICVKFNTVNDCAAPTWGIKTPSSWIKTPSENAGSNVTQRTPNSSRFKNAPFTPKEPAES